MSDVSANNPVPTLADLLQQANAQWRVFDMGRRIQTISKDEFKGIEAGQKPYPFPIQQKARMAVVFWDQQNTKGTNEKNPFIWFLQFDVDEMGLIKLQQRDHFIGIVIKELGSALVAPEGQDNSENLNNHPYSFTPDQNRQAAFNARVKVALKQPASMYFEHAQAYFNGQVHVDKWQELTVQGIADFAARINEAQNEKALIERLPELSVQILSVLAATLEHSQISLSLTEKLIELQEIALASDDHETVFHLLRCMSGSESKTLVQSQLKKLLSANDLVEESLLLIVAGRFWTFLTDDEIRHLYFDRAAQHTNQYLFHGVFADTVAIPSTRKAVLGLLRDPERSQAVSRALGVMFNA